MARIIKRTDLSKTQAVTFRLFSIVLALGVSALFILLLGHNPFEVYGSMVNGAFGSAYRLKETIIKAVPLVVTSLGITVAFK